MIELTKIEENPVDRYIVERTARKVAHILNVNVPLIIFFFPEDDERSLYGKYRNGQIFINCRLSEQDLMDTIAHELRHHWQAVTGKHRLNAVHSERDARIFEREWHYGLQAA